MADTAAQSLPHEAARPLLVGRERERALLREALAAALAGRGGVVLIGGEAGIGKTALAEDLLAEAAERGALSLVGRCYDLSETPPYGPWREIFDRAPRDEGMPALPTAVLPAERAGETLVSQEAIFARVRDHLAALAARRPLVLLLEDLHWADPASLDLLRVLARGFAELPLLVLVTYRADELTRRHPLYTLLPLLVREARADRLDLHALDAEALQSLVRVRYALAPEAETRLISYLATRADGNPLFTGELLRAVEEVGTLAIGNGGWQLGNLATVGVPMLLRQVIDGRVDRLGEAARDLLMLAAVIGQEVLLDLWAKLGGTGDALTVIVEQAVEAGLLVVSADASALRFAHALIREALYEGTPPLRRRAWHRRIGEALASLPQPDPDVVASHFRRAGDPRAVDWLVRAGERAHRANAWVSAAERFEVAIALLESQGSDPGARGWLLLRLARLRRESDPVQGLRYLDEALAMALTSDDHVLATCIRFSRGVLRCTIREIRGGVADMEAAVGALDTLSAADWATLTGVSITWLADTLSPTAHDTPVGSVVRELWCGLLVLWLGGVGRHEEALALGTEVITRTTDSTTTDPLAFVTCADAHFGLGFVYAAAGRPGEARASFQRARRRYAALDHAVAVTAVAGRELDTVVLPYQADRLAERSALAAEGSQMLARAMNMNAGRTDQQPHLPLFVLEGRWGEARALDIDGAFHKHWLGALALGQGDSALAREVVEETLPDGPATEPGGTILLPALALQQTAAALAIEAGDLPLARTWLECHDRWLAWSGAVLGRADGLLGRATYHRAAGDLTRAREYADRALASASDPRQPLALLAAHRLLGELATATGQLAEADRRFTEALALADACAAPHERALTLLALAELRAAEGHRDTAGTALAEARAILASLGAAPALARADALAARLVAAPAPSDALPFGLTPREAEVLRLVAEGLTNAQVADRLYLTSRTVNAHLTTIYGKLGVTSRTAAARVAVERGLG